MFTKESLRREWDKRVKHVFSSYKLAYLGTTYS